MNSRNIGIDVVKFIAVLLITNSHMELLYGKYGALATGGSIGDALFFFCSGFTLLMKPIGGGNFFNWYKRRINRIYPTVFAVAIVSCSLFGSNKDINSIILHGGGWFVSCIMIYYVFIYIIGKYQYLKKHIYWIMGGVAIATCIWFFSIDRPFPYNMYGKEGGYLKWLLCFIYMLLGAKMGMDNNKHEGHSVRDLVLSILSFALFYIIYILTRKVEAIEFLEILNFIPIIACVYYLLRWCNSPIVKKVYSNINAHFIIRFIGGLCLEIYLIQEYLFTDNLNRLFPLNIILVFAEIVIAAYLVRCLARFISQTFKDEPYHIKKIIEAF